MNHTLDCLKKVSNKMDELWKNKNLPAYLLVATLATLPLKHNIGSLACIVFLLFTFFKAKKIDFSFPKVLLLPILLYVLMFILLI